MLLLLLKDKINVSSKGILKIVIQQSVSQSRLWGHFPSTDDISFCLACHIECAWSLFSDNFESKRLRRRSLRLIQYLARTLKPYVICTNRLQWNPSGLKPLPIYIPSKSECFCFWQAQITYILSLWKGTLKISKSNNLLLDQCFLLCPTIPIHGVSELIVPCFVPGYFPTVIPISTLLFSLVI